MMRFVKILIVLTLILLFYGCSAKNEEDQKVEVKDKQQTEVTTQAKAEKSIKTPSEVFEEIVTALKEKDFERVKQNQDSLADKYMTLKEMESLSEDFIKVGVTVINEEIQQDYARVLFKGSINGTTRFAAWFFKKDGESWKLTNSDIMPNSIASKFSDYREITKEHKTKMLSHSKYLAIKKGMTYEEIVEIIGFEAIEGAPTSYSFGAHWHPDNKYPGELYVDFIDKKAKLKEYSDYKSGKRWYVEEQPDGSWKEIAPLSY